MRVPAFDFLIDHGFHRGASCSGAVKVSSGPRQLELACDWQIDEVECGLEEVTDLIRAGPEMITEQRQDDGPTDRNAEQCEFQVDGVNLREELLVAAQLGLAMLDDQRELIRVVFREMEPFPDLMERIRERNIQATYRYFAAWLDALADAGVARAVDAHAVAVVLVGSIVNFKVVETFLSEVPGPIAVDRFVGTWVDIADSFLNPIFRKDPA